MTYSFPCQDLSLAGKTQGMKKGSGTRSGLLWEVERILNELKARDELPQLLLMENVCQVHGTANWEDFNAWKKSLQEMGYCNFWQDLIATDYGIPQTRDRTFMVSILGDYNYEFPKPIKLEKSLKDLLEDEKDVPEKFYLSDKMMKYITSEDDKYKVSKSSLKVNRKIACSKTTREGYTRAEEGDGVDISTRMEHHRGTVQKGKAQTLSTMGGANTGVVVDVNKESKLIGGYGTKGSTNQYRTQNRI